MLGAGQVQGFVAGNQANNFGVAFHQFAFCKCEGTSKADVETNRFQRVNAHQAEIQFFLQLAQANGHSFTVNGVGAFAQQMPVAGHLDQFVIVAGNAFRALLDLLVGDDIVEHGRRVVDDVADDTADVVDDATGNQGTDGTANNAGQAGTTDNVNGNTATAKPKTTKKPNKKKANNKKNTNKNTDKNNNKKNNKR